MNNLNKRILFISPFFYPEPISTGKYNTDLVKGLCAKGYDVTVICSHPFYPEWIVKRTEGNLDNIKIIRGGAHIRYSKKPFLRRVILEIWFSVYALINVVKCRKNNDMIIFVFPPSFAAFIILPFVSNLNKIGIVHDLQDIYSAGKGLINIITKKLIQLIERYVFKRLDKIIFLSDEMKLYAERQYKLKTSKLEVHYPFTNIDTSTISNQLDHIFLKSKRHVVYSGALGKKQAPDKLYSFFDYASRKIPQTNFHFFSKGPYYDLLKSNNKNECILFHDLVKEENLLELYVKSTLQIIPQEKGTSQGSLPSKLPNLVASGCKIFLITDKNSELETLFKKNNLGIVATLWNNEELCSELEKYLIRENIRSKNHNDVIKKLFNLDSLIDQITKS